ncbi:MAG: formate hydrogenase [Leptospiraceae bacterium]|nr:formate hydrogenase [Leptospiraceae bacterium]MCP5512010.1 formate hydrogenase [Leptospiraceae bacterium]
MSLLLLSLIGVIVFSLIMILLLLTFAKSDEKIIRWSPLVVLLFVIILSSWWVKDLSLQWVLIEATTLFGALLISLSKTEKSLDVAWKFLIINSFGLGIAFLGIIFLSFGTREDVNSQLTLFSLLPRIPTHETLMVEAGIWLAVFGYTSKLGLFPNHFWVSDTYAESPSQISSILAALLPVSVILAIYPFVVMDTHFTSNHFSAKSGMLILGLITMMYSLWTVYQTDDLRRITALTAMFHSGGLAVFVYLYPDFETINYMLSANITVKTLLFSTMGILRVDAGARNFSEINPENGLCRKSLYLYILSVAMAFVLPISPFFISDLILIKLGMEGLHYWIIAVPIINLIFFLVVINKIIPLLKIKSRPLAEKNKKLLTTRINISYILFFVTTLVGIFGMYKIIIGEL